MPFNLSSLGAFTVPPVEARPSQSLPENVTDVMPRQRCVWITPETPHQLQTIPLHGERNPAHDR